METYGCTLNQTDSDILRALLLESGQIVVKGFKGRLGDFVDVGIVDANHGSLFSRMLTDSNRR